LNGDDVNLYLARAHAHRENREIDKAIPDIEAALKLDPNNAEARNFLELAKKMQLAKNQLFGST